MTRDEPRRWSTRFDEPRSSCSTLTRREIARLERVIDRRLSKDYPTMYALCRRETATRLSSSSSSSSLSSSSGSSTTDWTRGGVVENVGDSNNSSGSSEYRFVSPVLSRRVRETRKRLGEIVKRSNGTGAMHAIASLGRRLLVLTKHLGKATMFLVGVYATVCRLYEYYDLLTRSADELFEC